MPRTINKIPEIIDQILSETLKKFLSLNPEKIPSHKKTNWKILTKKGKKVGLIPIILPPIPMQILSKESAIPKIRDSLASISLELSKSEDLGLFIAWKTINKPIKIKIQVPIQLAKKLEKKLLIKLPSQIEIVEKQKETKKRTSLAKLEILVLLIPYVIPMLRESILLETAKIIVLKNIIAKSFLILT